MSAVPTSTPAAAARRSASVLLAASIAIGSVSFTLVQVALEELSPLTLATGRVVVSALMFTLVIVRSPWRRTPVLPGDRLRLFLCGFAGSAVFHLLFNWGQDQVSVAVAAVVMATYPILTAMGEVVFLHHRLHPIQVVGLVLSTAGCVLIGITGGGDGGDMALLGAVVVLLAAITWAGVTVATRSIGHRYDSWWLNTPGTVVGALVMLLLDIPRLDEFADLSWKGWLAVIWLGSASSAFIYYSMAKVMTVLSATTTTSITTVVTPLSVLVAWVFLGDAPSLVEVVGGAVVIAGVMLVVRHSAPADEPVEVAAVA